MNVDANMVHGIYPLAGHLRERFIDMILRAHPAAPPLAPSCLARRLLAAVAVTMLAACGSSSDEPRLVSIAVTPADGPVGVGRTQQLSATGRFSDGATKDLTASTTWDSSDDAIALVSNAADARGLATGIRQGRVTVTATSGGASATTTLTVTAVVDSAADTVASDGKCTLREAILNANAMSGAGSADCAAGTGQDVIRFELPYPSTITLGSALPTIAHELTIQGPGADRLTVSGGGAVRILQVNAGATLSVEGVTLASGAGGNGAAISNSGTTAVRSSAFSGNVSSASSGAIYNVGGSLSVSGCSFSGNRAASAGGAIGSYDGAVAEVTNSTFAGNEANGPWGGGAIYNRGATSSLAVRYSTFSGNTAVGGGGAVGNGGAGEPGGTAVLVASLLADNLAAGVAVNCFNQSGTLTDGGYNLEDADTCALGATSFKGTDPLALVLADNGGGTKTMALPAGSPAADRIPPGAAGCGGTVAVDQRGVARPQAGSCDVGAFERP